MLGQRQFTPNHHFAQLSDREDVWSQQMDGSSGRLSVADKQPYFIASKNARPFSIASTVGILGKGWKST